MPAGRAGRASGAVGVEVALVAALALLLNVSLEVPEPPPKEGGGEFLNPPAPSLVYQTR